jgi:hypothetical protein
MIHNNIECKNKNLKIIFFEILVSLGSYMYANLGRPTICHEVDQKLSSKKKFVIVVTNWLQLKACLVAQINPDSPSLCRPTKDQFSLGQEP